MYKSKLRKLLSCLNYPIKYFNLELMTYKNAEFLRNSRNQLLRYSPVDPIDNGKSIVLVDELKASTNELNQLKQSYRSLDTPLISHSWWNDDMVNADLDLANFRGDNAFVYQLRDSNTPAGYILTAEYLKGKDSLDLFNLLTEEGAFGVNAVYWKGDVLISRDLLDSINEIYFLCEAFGIDKIQNYNILDIGAGYGRFAHRFAKAMPNGFVTCVDAVPESTFICSKYLKYAGVERNTSVVALDDLINGKLSGTKIDLAVNIHSFSECSLATICGWLDVLIDLDVNNFLIVPNASDHEGRKLLSAEADGSRIDFAPELDRRGFKNVLIKAKFPEEYLQAYGVSPTHYHLFNRG